MIGNIILKKDNEIIEVYPLTHDGVIKSYRYFLENDDIKLIVNPKQGLKELIRESEDKTEFYRKLSDTGCAGVLFCGFPAIVLTFFCALTKYEPLWWVTLPFYLPVFAGMPLMYIGEELWENWDINLMYEKYLEQVLEK